MPFLIELAILSFKTVGLRLVIAGVEKSMGVNLLSIIPFLHKAILLVQYMCFNVTQLYFLGALLPETQFLINVYKVTIYQQSIKAHLI